MNILFKNEFISQFVNKNNYGLTFPIVYIKQLIKIARIWICRYIKIKIEIKKKTQ